MCVYKLYKVYIYIHVPVHVYMYVGDTIMGYPDGCPYQGPGVRRGWQRAVFVPRGCNMCLLTARHSTVKMTVHVLLVLGTEIMKVTDNRSPDSTYMSTDICSPDSTYMSPNICSPDSTYMSPDICSPDSTYMSPGICSPDSTYMSPDICSPDSTYMSTDIC